LDNQELGISNTHIDPKKVLRCISLVAMFAGIGGLPSGGIAADQLPRSPIQPTLDDCQQMLAAYQRLNRQLEHATLDCYSGQSRIGAG
jgi:hypothetical protein